ncbi:histamine H3 receptor-like [Pseudophryne corroboree]|uniref:histamine H3 receptor-like n=1 Tax=Pseudophryne corroboree TaxID=495146 RepID=UPI003081ADCB
MLRKRVNFQHVWEAEEEDIAAEVLPDRPEHRDRVALAKPNVIYRSVQKKHSQTILKMATVWLLSFLLYGPALLIWESVFGNKGMAKSDCVPAFSDSWLFHLASSAFDLFIPLVSISFFNLSIYLNITKRSRKKRQPVSDLNGGNDTRPFIIATNQVLFSAQLDGIQNMAILRQGLKKFPRQCFSRKIAASSSQMDIVHNSYNICVIDLSRDKRIAKYLAILVCTFAICWAPYTFLIFLNYECQGYCIPSYWYDITLWVLYLNSAINPILYPLCHKSFRKAFSTILRVPL